jgi:hypothetical protein
VFDEIGVDGPPLVESDSPFLEVLTNEDPDKSSASLRFFTSNFKHKYSKKQS